MTAEARAARDELIEQNLGLAYAAARGSRFEDALSVAFLTLVRAAEGFDPSRGVRFSTYAFRAMRRAIADARWEDRTIRLPKHLRRLLRDRARGLPLRERSLGFADRALRVGPLDPREPAPRPPEEPVDPEDRARALAAVATLDTRLRRVLEARARGLTHAQAGAELGVTKERSRQLERAAIGRARAALAAGGGGDILGAAR